MIKSLTMREPACFPTRPPGAVTKVEPPASSPDRSKQTAPESISKAQTEMRGRAADAVDRGVAREFRRTTIESLPLAIGRSVSKSA